MYKLFRRGVSLVEYEGKIYTSISALCRDFGINRTLFYYYKNRTESVSDAITSAIKSQMETNYLPTNMGVRTALQVAHRADMDYTTLKYMMLHFSLTAEDAVVQYQAEGFMYDGKRYEKLHELLDEHNITIAGLDYRINKGMCFAEALNRVKLDERSNKYRNRTSGTSQNGERKS